MSADPPPLVLGERFPMLMLQLHRWRKREATNADRLLHGARTGLVEVLTEAEAHRLAALGVQMFEVVDKAASLDAGLEMWADGNHDLLLADRVSLMLERARRYRQAADVVDEGLEAHRRTAEDPRRDWLDGSALVDKLIKRSSRCRTREAPHQ